jgi:hypothetical protein
MNERLKSFLDRLVLVEGVAVKANSDASKILAVETQIKIILERVVLLENCQIKANAQGSTLATIWKVLNNPIVLFAIAMLVLAYEKLNGWNI